jgi:hypothetical protein
MELHDPVVVYTAADNAEAAHVCQMLTDAGIEAYFMADDPTTAGTALGLMPQIHKPRVWVDRQDVERAQPLLLEHERRVQERREGRDQREGEPVVVTCDRCGERAAFPPEQRGTVQSCPSCGGYLDVGEEGHPEGWLRGVAERWRGGPPRDGGDEEGIVRGEDREGISQPDEGIENDEA